VKHMLLGHWGTPPGQNFIYAHLNRAIKKFDLNMVYVSGPGHGSPAVVGNTYLEGTYSEVYPDISQDEEELSKLFYQFSLPSGIPSDGSWPTRAISVPKQAPKRNLPKLSCNFSVMRECEDKSPSLTN
jgi:phosphoketolase